MSDGLELAPQLYEDFAAAKARLDEAKEAYEALRNEVIKLMASADASDGLVGGERRLTMTCSRSLRLDSKRLKDSFPEVWHQFAVPQRIYSVHLVKERAS